MTPQAYRNAYLDGIGLGRVLAPSGDERLVTTVTRARCFGSGQVAPPVALSRLSELLAVLDETLPEPVQDMGLDDLADWLRDRRDRVMQLETRQGELEAGLSEAQRRLEEKAGFIDRIMRSPSMRVGRALTSPARLLRPRLPALRAAWSGLRRQGLRALNPRRLLRGPREDPAYDLWLKRHGGPDERRRAAMTARQAQLARRPLVSLLMPVYNTDPDLLRHAVDSVRSQVYPNWELLVVDDASTSSATVGVLDELEAADERVRVLRRKSNGHISAASNTALEAAAGEWVGLLDHDDLLAPDALYWVLEEINGHPDCGLIYSDEDKVTEDGRRYDPCFKPDWNPDLLRSQNYVNHFSVYRRELVERAGGFREGFEGAQDYDLVLRVTEGLASGQVRHIPRILYHWRAVADSTAGASAAAAKPYAAEAARLALTEHLKRTGQGATVLPAPGFEGIWWRVRYPLPPRPPRVSIIMPTRNALNLLLDSVPGVMDGTDYPDYELIVIDNGSDDPATLHYLEFIARDYGVRVVRDDRPFNYSQLNNDALPHATGSVLVLMNNDIRVINRDWLRELVSQAMRPEIGLVGARLWFPDDTLQHAGCVLGVGGVAAHAFLRDPRGAAGYFGRAALLQNYSAVTAACVAIRRSVFEEVGGLNETDLRVAFNDVDLCLRVLKAGYRNLWTPYAELYHVESASRGYEDTPDKQARFGAEIAYMRSRWGRVLDSDPAYNPNLTLHGIPFRLAAEPRLPADPWDR